MPREKIEKKERNWSINMYSLCFIRIRLIKLESKSTWTIDLINFCMFVGSNRTVNHQLGNDFLLKCSIRIAHHNGSLIKSNIEMYLICKKVNFLTENTIFVERLWRKVCHELYELWNFRKVSITCSPLYRFIQTITLILIWLK